MRWVSDSKCCAEAIPAMQRLRAVRALLLGSALEAEASFRNGKQSLTPDRASATLA